MRKLRTHLTTYKARLYTGQECMYTFIYTLKETRKRTGERAQTFKSEHENFWLIPEHTFKGGGGASDMAKRLKVLTP